MEELLILLALSLVIDLPGEPEEELEASQYARRLDRFLDVVDIKRTLPRDDVHSAHSSPLDVTVRRVGGKPQLIVQADKLDATGEVVLRLIADVRRIVAQDS